MIQLINFNFKLASNFNFLNNANNQFLIGKSSDGASKSITGQILELSYSCRTFHYNHIENYKILPSLREGLIKAAHLFDEDQPTFHNYISLTKQCVTNRGGSAQVENVDPALITDGSKQYLEVTHNKYFLVRASDFGDKLSDTLRVYTAIMHIGVLQLPEKGRISQLFAFETDKRIPIKISWLGQLIIDGTTTLYSNPGVRISAGNSYYVKMTMTRFINQGAPHDCSIGVEVFGVGELGGDLECKTKNIEKKQIIKLTFRSENFRGNRSDKQNTLQNRELLGTTRHFAEI